MKYFKILAAIFAVSLSLASYNAVAAEKHALKERLVIQVSDADAGKWNLALNNANNVQHAFGAKKVAIEIVAYGPGIGMLKMDSTVGNQEAAARLLIHPPLTRTGQKIAAPGWTGPVLAGPAIPIAGMQSSYSCSPCPACRT